MGPSRQKAGFTLLELMIAVSIIGISLLSFAPAFKEAMADRRVATATMELARMGRRARLESIGKHRAYLVNVALGPSGRFRVLRGLWTRCARENWAAHANACGTNVEFVGAGGGQCVENHNLASSHWFHSPYVIRLALNTTVVNGEVSFCYEPNGTIAHSVNPITGAMTFSTLNAGPAAGGGALIDVNLMVDGAVVGMGRTVLFPLGTTPRRIR